MKTVRHLLIPSLVVVAVLAPPAQAQEDYAGTFKATFAKREALPIGDAEGHVLILADAQAINRSTGKVAFFDDGRIEVKDVIDITNGNGTQSGYIIFSKNGERTVSKLSGKVVTVMAPDGKTPMTTVEGTFEQVFGTNLYGTVKPSGEYKTRVLSPTEFETEWKVTRMN
jgi:hypothetical protein